VWEDVLRWVSQSLLTGLEGWNHFLCFGKMVKSKKGNRIRHLIWLATTWCIWKHRNNVIFNGGLPNANALLENIKAISWIWFKDHLDCHSSLSFANWCIDPLVYLKSI
jgi:hypothetical protein